MASLGHCLPEPQGNVVAQGARFTTIAPLTMQGRARVRAQRSSVSPLKSLHWGGWRLPATLEEETGSLHTARVHII